MTKSFLFILFLNAFVIYGLAAEQQNHTVQKPHENSTSKQLHPNTNESKNNVSHVEIKSQHTQNKTNPISEKPKQPPPVHINEPIKNTKINKTVVDTEAKILPSINDQESTVLTRGTMILVSISLLFIVFVAFKTYRRKSRNARIKKYGIRLARGNIEMTPLPLDNDDDDETIFDLKNVPT